MVDMELESELIFLENRIRDLISNLVAPIIKKVEDHDTQLQKLQKHDVKHKLRHSNLDDKMQRSLLRLVPLEDFNKKMFDVFSESRTLEHNTTRRLESFNNSINQLTHHFDYLKVSYKTMEEVQSNNEKMFKASEKSIRETKESVNKQLSTAESLLKKNLYESTHLLETLNGKIDNLFYKFNELNEKSMPSLQFFMRKMKEHNDNLTQKVEGLSKERVTFKDIREFKFRMETDNSNMRNRLNTDLKSINSFFDKALKFTISSEIYEVLIDTSTLSHLEAICPVVKSDLRQTLSLIEDSKDMKSENYQLPSSTLTHLMHLKRVFEKQLKVIDERKTEIQSKQASNEKISEIISNFESMSQNTLSKELSNLNSTLKTEDHSKGLESSSNADEGFRVRKSFLLDVTGPQRKSKEEGIHDKSPGLKPVDEVSASFKSVGVEKTEDKEAKKEIAKVKSENLSIGGVSHISVERLKNNIQTVLDIRITPAHPHRGLFTEKSFDHYEPRPYTGSIASNLRESFQMNPPQIYQKPSTPLPMLAIKERIKQEKSKLIGSKLNFEQSESASEELSFDNSESSKVNLGDVKYDNEDLKASEEAEINEEGKNIKNDPKPKRGLEPKPEPEPQAVVRLLDEKDEAQDFLAQGLNETQEKIEIRNKAEKRKTRSKTNDKGKTLKKMIEKNNSGKKIPERKVLTKKLLTEPGKVSKSQDIKSNQETPLVPSKQTSKPEPVETLKSQEIPKILQSTELKREGTQGSLIKSDDSARNLSIERQSKLDPYVSPRIMQSEIEAHKLELSKIKEDFTRVAEKNSKKLKKTQEKLIKFSTDFIQNEIKKLKIAKKEALDKIEQSAETVRNMMINDQEELRINIRLIYDENKYLMKQRNTDMMKVDNEVKQLNSVQLDQSNDIRYLKEELQSIKNFQDCLLESSKILFNLLKQDEKDRENLQLTGLGESKSHSKVRPTLTLRPECLSCSGQASSVYSAFKLACINYLPSEVEHKSKLLPRKTLIRVLGEYLSHIHEFPYFTPTLLESKLTAVNEENFLKSSSKTPKISSRYLLNNSTSRITDLDSSILKRY